MLHGPPSGATTETVGKAAYDMERGRGRAAVLEESPLVAQGGCPFPVGSVSGKPGAQVLAMTLPRGAEQ